MWRGFGRWDGMTMYIDIYICVYGCIYVWRWVGRGDVRDM